MRHNRMNIKNLLLIGGVCIFALTPLANVAAQISAGSLAPGAIQLVWQAPGDDGQLGQASMYSVRYSTDSALLVNWDAASEAPTNAPLPPGSQESLMVTGLDPSTRYYFAIKTCDEAHNWSEMSNIVSVTTEGSTMLVSGVNVSDINSNDITVNWTTSEPGTQQIHFGFTTALEFSTALDTVMRTVHNVTVDSLPSAATIYFRVASRDSYGIEVLSSFYQINTDSASQAPLAIADLAAGSGESNGEIDLSWTAPFDDGPEGAVAYYLIQLCADPFGETDTAGIVIYPTPPTPATYGTRQRFTLSSLAWGEMYYVAMRSVDAEGNVSAMSNLDSAIATFSIIADVDDDQDGLPDDYSLGQNYPNPFNPTTTIAYALPESGDVTLQVFNINGQVVSTLIDESQPAGYHQIEWDGHASNGAPAATGVYFYRLTTNDFVESKKMMLLK